MSDQLISYLLKHFEGSPQSKFYESELTRISSSGFPDLKKRKFLLFDQYDFEHESYFDREGNEHFVRKVNGRWIATSTEDPEISPLYLKEQDLNRYTFNLQPLLAEIKAKNSLTKNISAVTSRLWFIGECHSGTRQFGVFLGLFSDDGQAKELLGVRSGVGQYENIIVLCPAFEISDQNLLNRLESQKIYCFPFKQIFKNDDFKIDFSVIREGEKAQTGFVVPDLNSTERRKYQKNYPRKDVIEFTDRQTGQRSYIVLINGKEVPIQYGPLAVLLFLAIALKQEKSFGWVTKEDVDREGIINDMSHFHRLISELKRLAKPFIDANAKVELIDNLKRQSKYRLTTMPSRIKAPHSRWLTQKYKFIKAEVIKEREKRSKKKQGVAV